MMRTNRIEVPTIEKYNALSLSDVPSMFFFCKEPTEHCY